MLSVGATLTLGNSVYDSHAARVRLRRGLLPIVDRLDVELPPSAQLDAAPGDPALLDLDGGEGAERVFTGKISAIARSFAGLRVSAHHGAFALGRYRPSMTLEGVVIGDVVRKLCADAEVDTGDVADGPDLALYVALGRATALDEIARLAALFGASAAFDADGRVHVFTPPDGGPAEDLALKYGRELIDVGVERALADAASRTVIGEGAAGPNEPEARWPVSDFFAGAAENPGPSARRRAEPEIRTVDDARAASSAWASRRAAFDVPVRVRAWLLPRVAPGGLVQLAEMPKEVDVSALRVRQVLHRLDPERGAFTELWGSEDTGSGGGGGLLGAIAGAVGGLL